MNATTCHGARSAAIRFQAILAAALFLTIVSSAAAKYSGGTGEPNDPYQIATAADLIALGETPEDYGKQFILTADIDLDPNLPGRKVFNMAAIAVDANEAGSLFDSSPFTGVFDGKGHTVSHLVVAGGRLAGLFGVVESGAAIRDLGVVDVNITGPAGAMGGLIGLNSGNVLRCYSTGTVQGVGNVGGLVGSNWGSVMQSYSTSAARGSGEVGGLVGSNLGEVGQCYSAGVVAGTGNDVGGLVGTNERGIVTQCYSTAAVHGSGEFVGGLVGNNLYGLVTASFWDIQTSGQPTSPGGLGETTAQMQNIRTYLNAGWDFVGETANGMDNIWWITEGRSYPRLGWQGPPGIVFVDIPAGTFEMGDRDAAAGGGATPVHTVTLDGFQMSQYETTNSQYAVYLNAALADGLIQVVNGVVYASADANRVEPYCDTTASSPWSQIEYRQGQFTVRSRDGQSMSDHPMARLSWYGSKAFCDYYGCRLPTEAEWEYAAHGGFYDPYYRFPWGSNSIDCTKANCKTGTTFCNPLNLTSWPYTTPVGYYGPQGAYGLCDMSGNLWEWCQDWHDAGYYSISPTHNPTGPTTGKYRILRGGAWDVDGKSCDIVGRCVGDPLVRGHVTGFRVCR